MPPSIPPFALVCVALLMGGWLGLRSSTERVRRRIARNQQRGRRAEVLAETLLMQAGYRILRRQAKTTIRIKIGGRTEEYEVRADFLVRRLFRTYVAEVKSGGAATLGHAPTRRQLLEYRHAFRCNRLLLVDADRARISRVAF